VTALFFRNTATSLTIPSLEACGGTGDRSPSLDYVQVLLSKIHTVKKYYLSFILYSLFYSTLFLNFLRSYYSKFILYIIYHPYFTIFYRANFYLILSQLPSYIFYYILLAQTPYRSSTYIG
jgi:hypothetical protein